MKEMQNQKEQLFVISEAARFLGVSIDTVRRWDKAGLLHSVRPTGKARYFASRELEQVKRSPTGFPAGPRTPTVSASAVPTTNALSIAIGLGKLTLILLTVIAMLFLLFPEQITKLLTL